MGLCSSSESVTSVKTSVKPSVNNEKSETTKNPTRKKNIPKSLKRQVWDYWIGADLGTALCLCCKYQVIRQIEFHCGHVLAEANGGKLSVENLRPICAQCNLSMGKKDFKTFAQMFSRY